MSQDPLEAIITLLKADAPLAALVSDRVYGVELPPSEAETMPRKAVVVRPSGGPSFASGSFIEHDQQRYDVLGYGETVIEAEKVRRAAFDVFRAVRRSVASGTLIHWIEAAGGWATQRESDTAWPLAFQSITVLYAHQAA